MNKKDLTIVPKVLTGIIVASTNTKEQDIVNEAISQIKISFRKSLYETLNIGYWVTQIKLKSSPCELLKNLKKVGLTKVYAHYYTVIYKKFSELDTKKSLKAFEQIEFSKLREIARLSKYNLNELAKQPELIDVIKSQTTKEFKYQLLPGLLDGNIKKTLELQRKYEFNKKELAITQAEKYQLIDEKRELETKLDSQIPRLISDIKIQSFAMSESALTEIKSLKKLCVSITSGRNSKEFDLQEQMYRTDALSEITNATRALLANVSELYNFVVQNLTPSEAVLDPMNEKEIEQALIELEKRKTMISNIKGHKHGI